MEEEKMIPVCCNNFGVGTNNGVTFILDFRFQEPPSEHGQPGPIKTVARVAMDRIGIERFMLLLQTTLEKTKGKDQPPAPENPRF
ncbi:MAG: hypothetical protein ABIG31_05255 [Candidatus Omnitrophota bacterium]